MGSTRVAETPDRPATPDSPVGSPTACPASRPAKAAHPRPSAITSADEPRRHAPFGRPLRGSMLYGGTMAARTIGCAATLVLLACGSGQATPGPGTGEASSSTGAGSSSSSTGADDEPTTSAGTTVKGRGH